MHSDSLNFTSLQADISLKSCLFSRHIISVTLMRHCFKKTPSENSFLCWDISLAIFFCHNLLLWRFPVFLLAHLKKHVTKLADLLSFAWLFLFLTFSTEVWCVALMFDLVNEHHHSDSFIANQTSTLSVDFFREIFIFPLCLKSSTFICYFEFFRCCHLWKLLPSCVPLPSEGLEYLTFVYRGVVTAERSAV